MTAVVLMILLIIAVVIEMEMIQRKTGSAIDDSVRAMKNLTNTVENMIEKLRKE